MDLIDSLQTLSARVDKQLEHIHTEEATKNALVLPFINALGYNVFDPTEVVPEFSADASVNGLKKNEKVDYAIRRGNELVMLIECKHVGAPLANVHASQLLRYFHVTQARVGVLTNGLVYRFFSDLDEPNKMDSRPFLEFDLRDIREPVVAELKKLTRAHFDVGTLVEGAQELKYLRELKAAIAEEFEAPSEDLLRVFANRVGIVRVTQGVRDQFAPLLARAFHQFLNERLNARLQGAIVGESVPLEAPEVADAPKTSGDPETTAEEMEGYHIVRAILRESVDVSRIAHRDVKSYFGVLLDDNNRKPICRLHFNTAQKYVEVFDTEEGERVPIETVDEIYDLKDRLRAAVSRYDAL